MHFNCPGTDAALDVPGAKFNPYTSTPPTVPSADVGGVAVANSPTCARCVSRAPLVLHRDHREHDRRESNDPTRIARAPLASLDPRRRHRAPHPRCPRGSRAERSNAILFDASSSRDDDRSFTHRASKRRVSSPRASRRARASENVEAGCVDVENSSLGWLRAFEPRSSRVASVEVVVDALESRRATGGERFKRTNRLRMMHARPIDGRPSIDANSVYRNARVSTRAR